MGQEKRLREQPSRRAVAGMATVLVLTGAAPALAQSTEEIVVTARKREESLRDVPVAVTAFSGGTIERNRIREVTGLIGETPSLSIAQNQTFGPMSNQTFLVMRGVGATASSEPAVAVFVDGVYVPSLAFNLDFFDLERVEILRGPQGALFGRNTQGGAVNIVTRKPTDETVGKLMLGYGSFDTARAQASLSGPLVAGKVFAAVAAGYEHSDGYLHNALTGGDQNASDRYRGRASVRFLPTDTLEIIATVSGQTAREGDYGFGVPANTKKYDTFYSDNHKDRNDVTNAALTVNLDVGNVRLTSITGGNWISTDYLYDFDGGPARGNIQQQFTQQNSISEEFRVASNNPDSSVSWLLGGFYFEEKYRLRRNFTQGECGVCTVPPIFDFRNVVRERTRFDRDGYAFFGQATWRPIEGLDITGGLRFSKETVQANQDGIIYLAQIGANDHFAGVNQQSFYALTPMGSISYKWTKDILTYATISQGYKAGGFDRYPGSSDGLGTHFNSEKSINYEIGAKTSFLDRRLTLDVAAYIIKLDDQQLATTVISPSTHVPVGVTQNAGTSTIRGAEIEATIRPAPDWMIKASYSYNHARFDKFITDRTNGANRNGETVPNLPPYEASASVTYQAMLPAEVRSQWELKIRGVGRYNVGNGIAPFDPKLPVPAWRQVDAQVTFDRGPWTVTLFASNLFDTYIRTRLYQPAFQPDLRATVAAPRQVGFLASYNF